jgi:hypothetical protein
MSRLSQRLWAAPRRALVRSLRWASPAVARWLRQRVNNDARLAAIITQRQGLIVGQGPFAGMHYLDTAAGSTYVCKLVGAYEAELDGVVEELVARSFSTIVNVGSAEGYYAVGLARRIPSATVYAFDGDDGARQASAELARRNGVAERVEVRGWCDVEALRSVVGGGEHTLVVCDCEGGEDELLDPVKIPALRSATLLVELHDCFVPGVTQRLRERFEPTHDVRLIDDKPRDLAKFPVLAGLSRADQAACVDERREINGVAIQQQWAVMIPRGPNR